MTSPHEWESAETAQQRIKPNRLQLLEYKSFRNEYFSIYWNKRNWNMTKEQVTVIDWAVFKMTWMEIVDM